MSRVVIHDYWGDHVQPWLKGLVSYFENKGSLVEVWTRRPFASELLMDSSVHSPG